MDINPSATSGAAAVLDLMAVAARRRRTFAGGLPKGVRERRVSPNGRRSSDAIKMTCPFCAESASSVVRSRGGIQEDKVGRRRECAGCGRRFPTCERLDEEALERELAQQYGQAAVDESLASAAPTATWDNAERLLHHLWGQAKDRQYVKRDWNDFQRVLEGLRRA